MVAASKRPVSELIEIIGQINGNERGDLEKEARLITRKRKDRVEIIPTCAYTLLHQGEIMAAIYTKDKIAVLFHPQHYKYRRDFEDRLKPLVDYLFRNKYILMSKEEYDERTKNANN